MQEGAADGSCCSHGPGHLLLPTVKVQLNVMALVVFRINTFDINNEMFF